MLVVKKLNSVKSIRTFNKTAKGFKATNPEGYVAIDRVSGNAVKLVDRMEFSFNNFTAVKEHTFKCQKHVMRLVLIVRDTT